MRRRKKTTFRGHQHSNLRLSSGKTGWKRQRLLKTVLGMTTEKNFPMEREMGWFLDHRRCCCFYSL